MALADRAGHRWWRPSARALLAGTLLECGGGAEAVALLAEAAAGPGTTAPRRTCCAASAPLAEATGDAAVLAEADALLRRDRRAARRGLADRDGRLHRDRPCWSGARRAGPGAGGAVARCWPPPPDRLAAGAGRGAWRTGARRPRSATADEAAGGAGPGPRAGGAARDAHDGRPRRRRRHSPAGVSPLRRRNGRATAVSTLAPAPPDERRDAGDDETSPPAVDRPDRLNELLGRVIGDLGATTTAGGVVVGHRLGLYSGARPRRPGDRRRSSPRAPTPTRGTSPSGCAGRRPAATSSTTRRPAGSR